jgi:hypothetical protein
MFSFFSKKEKPISEPSEQYTKLRNSLLLSTPDQFNIRPSEKNPNVWGVLIDENFGTYVQSLRVTADGQMNIFQFAGETPLREDPRMAKLIRLLLIQAEATSYSSLTSTTPYTLPSISQIRFSILTFVGTYSIEVEVKELAISGEKHPLTRLTNAYHAILFLNKWGRLQSPIDITWFQPYAAGEQTKVYSQPDLNSTVITEFMDGDEFEFGVRKEVDGNIWFTVTLPSGQWGYISGKSKVLPFLQLSLVEKEVVIYSERSTQSAVITRMKKNALYYVIPTGTDEKWAKIRDSSGNEGFIDGSTRGIKVN